MNVFLSCDDVFFLFFSVYVVNVNVMNVFVYFCCYDVILMLCGVFELLFLCLMLLFFVLLCFLCVCFCVKYLWYVFVVYVL